MTHIATEVIEVTEGTSTVKQAWLAHEVPLTISVNGQQYITLLTTADNLAELAVGFAFNEGLLDTKADIQKIDIDQDYSGVNLVIKGDLDIPMRLAKTRAVTTGCGKGSSYYRAIDSLLVKPAEKGICLHYSTVYDLMREFNKKPTKQVEVGSVHGAALAQDTIQVFREDVARHNTVDMLAGHLILNEKKGKDYALITSGRITSELIIKAVRAKIGLVISRSAPSELAANLARKLNVTVVGFARGKRFNIYTQPERITGRTDAK